MDRRVDLFALGATAYYTLTQIHAYGARNLSALPTLWRTLPKPPSAFVDNIPEELDQLVMALLALDPLARPANAAEVIERLSAIADLEIDEQLVVSQAYLSTPTLVGRKDHLALVQKGLLRALVFVDAHNSDRLAIRLD